MEFVKTKDYLDFCLEKKIFTNCTLSIGDRNGETFRYLLDDGKIKTDGQTLFDMASVTKVVVTALLILLSVDSGKLKLESTLGEFFPNAPEDKKSITVKQLLTHTSGIKPYFVTEDTNDPSEVYDCILKKPLCAPVGEKVIYCCNAYNLLGRMIEMIHAETLSVLFERMVASRLGLTNSMFLPSSENIVYSRQRVAGNTDNMVNDNNAYFLGGIAGNAGLFSCIDDMSVYAKALTNRFDGFLSKELMKLVLTNHTPKMEQSRGLGFLLVDENYMQSGGLFAIGSYGHCGHTGTSVFADKNSGLTVTVLTNAAYCVKEDYDTVMKMRHDIHAAIKEDLQL